MKVQSSRRNYKTNGIGITVAAMAATALLSGARLAPDAAGETLVHIQETARTVTAAVARPAAGSWYTVRNGDTLSVIAGKEYGRAGCWPGIYGANRGRISNPNVIYSGQGISIPGYCGTHQPAGVQQPSSAGGGYSVSSSFQACVIRTESGGNPDVRNASGHWGLYQFSEGTWIAHGGASWSFGNASATEQTRVFWNTVTQDGTSDWAPYDGC